MVCSDHFLFHLFVCLIIFYDRRCSTHICFYLPLKPTPHASQLSPDTFHLLPHTCLQHHHLTFVTQSSRYSSFISQCVVCSLSPYLIGVISFLHVRTFSMWHCHIQCDTSIVSWFIWHALYTCFSIVADQHFTHRPYKGIISS